MFLSLPTTLPTSRFSLARRTAQLAATVLALPLGAFAQSAPSASAPVAASAVAPVAASATAPANDFDVRQKALDRRSAENEYEYGVAAHNCYDRFFVNACLNHARDKMRDVKAQIHTAQMQLDDERRAQRAQQRDEQIAIRRAQDEADAPERAATDARNAQAFADKQRQHELDEAQRTGQAPQRAANVASYNQKQADFQRKLDQAQQQAAQDAQMRAEKAQHFSQKQADAAQHKADVAARQKQAAEKAQQQQQQQLQQQEQQKQLRQQEQEDD